MRNNIRENETASSCTGSRRRLCVSEACFEARRPIPLRASIDLCLAAAELADARFLRRTAGAVQPPEHSVRPFAIGRKNWLFGNTPLGAKICAVIYSLVETAKTNGLNPASYLEYLLNALPRGSLPGDCLPWLPAVQAICKA